jgi:dTMP kinase
LVGRRRPRFPGVLIALEGGEGAGKSSQARRLGEWLESLGYDVVVTYEPGATPVGREIRRLLLDPATGEPTRRAEALLYAADRAHHVDTVIRPALERGAVVVTDRYVDSSIAYQGAGRELSADEVARISEWATGGVLANLTIVLDVDPAIGLARSGGADRMEQQAIEFHRRAATGTPWWTPRSRPTPYRRRSAS